ncbi:MAG TPA: hypothetical protein GXX30_09340 [Firmicutes bacterium]|nr:hypothetical protein [Candidatus Fermentithermobacillaceae bacterium]
MLIARAVTVKSRVTPNLRAQLGAETQKAIRDIDQEISRIEADLEARRTAGKSEEAVRLEKEKRELSSRREALVARLRDITRLKDGEEITRGQIQGFYDLKVGDMWPEVQACEIVLEEGRVVAIREGRAVSVLAQPEPAGTSGCGTEH